MCKSEDSLSLAFLKEQSIDNVLIKTQRDYKVNINPRYSYSYTHQIFVISAFEELFSDVSESNFGLSAC